MIAKVRPSPSLPHSQYQGAFVANDGETAMTGGFRGFGKVLSGLARYHTRDKIHGHITTAPGNDTRGQLLGILHRNTTHVILAAIVKVFAHVLCATARVKGSQQTDMKQKIKLAIASCCFPTGRNQAGACTSDRHTHAHTCTHMHTQLLGTYHTLASQGQKLAQLVISARAGRHRLECTDCFFMLAKKKRVTNRPEHADRNKFVDQTSSV